MELNDLYEAGAESMTNNTAFWTYINPINDRIIELEKKINDLEKIIKPMEEMLKFFTCIFHSPLFAEFISKNGSELYKQFREEKP